jgi:BON domain
MRLRYKRLYGVKGVAKDIQVKPERERTDPRIARDAVEALVRNVSVPDTRIKVTVNNGQIVLEGNVEWNYQKNAAEAAVRDLFDETNRMLSHVSWTNVCTMNVPAVSSITATAIMASSAARFGFSLRSSCACKGCATTANASAQVIGARKGLANNQHKEREIPVMSNNIVSRSCFPEIRPAIGSGQTGSCRCIIRDSCNWVPVKAGAQRCV